MPDLRAAAITVNGKKITGFNPGTSSYSYLLTAASKGPQVSATAAGKDIAVDIIQAAGVPGTAVITLADNVTVEKNQYYVNFGVRSVTDQFTTATLGKHWSWIRENPANWSLTKKAGTIVITSAEGDIQAASNNAENILLQSANTDWTITSKMIFSRRPSGFGQNGGLIAYQDDDNYVKLVYSSGGGGRMGFGGGGTGGQSAGSLLLVIEENGNQKNAATLRLNDIIKDDNTLFLRFEKKGSLFKASCSPDGKKFIAVGEGEAMLKDVKAGMIVCNGVPMSSRFGNIPGMPGGQQPREPETPFEVTYDYIHFLNNGLK